VNARITTYRDFLNRATDVSARIKVTGREMMKRRTLIKGDDVDFFWTHGYLRVGGVFSTAEVQELKKEVDWLIDVWAMRSKGWTGPWREALLGSDSEKADLTTLADPHFYSAAVLRALVHPSIADAAAGLLASEVVELHQSTLVVKPPETGQPFPTHQDEVYYPHETMGYVEALIHLDDTNAQNGELRFLDGSHRLGPLSHITQTAEGSCAAHLPVDQYRLDDTTTVPAKVGDVVFMGLRTVHGSYLNSSSDLRSIIRAGYRDPANRQLGGAGTLGRPGLIVRGRRPQGAKFF
jgi:phytanoyl-CoA hydroxylase